MLIIRLVFVFTDALMILDLMEHLETIRQILVSIDAHLEAMGIGIRRTGIVLQFVPMGPMLMT